MTADLTTLLKNTHLSTHEEILASATHALKTSKSPSPDAQRARIVALLKLERYEDALRALEEGGAQLRDSAGLEHAYALYKLGQYEAAEKVAREAGEGRGGKHILAQVLYRLEKFGEAGEVYAELSDESAAARREASDLVINGSAVEAQRIWGGEVGEVGKRQPGRQDLEAFEPCYNAACAAVARGELGKADMLLKRARDLCVSSNELTEEQKSEEVVPIACQMGYVLVKMGREEEAKKVMETVDLRTADEATRYFAQVNMAISSQGTGNPFLLKRLISTGPKLEGRDKPFAYQEAILASNSGAIELLSLKHSGILRRAGAQLEENNGCTADASRIRSSILYATAKAQGQTGKKAIRTLTPLFEEHPDDIGLLLTLVELHRQLGDYNTALSLLRHTLTRLEESENLQIRHAPGLVALLVSLHASVRGSHMDGPKILTEFAQSTSYWLSRHAADHSLQLDPALLRTAGDTLLHSSDTDHLQLSRSIHEHLRSLHPSDSSLSLPLAASQSLTSPSSSPTSLPPVPSLSQSEIDIDALEAAGLPPLSQPTSTKRPLTHPPDDKAKASPPKTKAKRRRRLPPKRTPALFEPNKQLDPERWIPLRDRAGFRPRKKGAKAGRSAGGAGGSATQGGVAEKGGPTQGGAVEKGIASGAGAKKKKGKGRK